MTEDAILISLDHAIDVLNRAVEKDQHAMTVLMEATAVVNNELAEDPTIQVYEYKYLGATYKAVRLLGIINSLFGIRSDGYGYITMVVDDKTGLIVRFERTKPEE